MGTGGGKGGVEEEGSALIFSGMFAPPFESHSHKESSFQKTSIHPPTEEIGSWKLFPYPLHVSLYTCPALPIWTAEILGGECVHLFSNDSLLQLYIKFKHLPLTEMAEGNRSTI